MSYKYTMSQIRIETKYGFEIFEELHEASKISYKMIMRDENCKNPYFADFIFTNIDKSINIATKIVDLKKQISEINQKIEKLQDDLAFGESEDEIVDNDEDE